MSFLNTDPPSSGEATNSKLNTEQVFTHRQTRALARLFTHKKFKYTPTGSHTRHFQILQMSQQGKKFRRMKVAAAVAAGSWILLIMSVFHMPDLLRVYMIHYEEFWLA